MPIRCPLILALAAGLTAQAQLPSALSTDPPADKASPAAMESFQIPSHGDALNALVYIAEGPGPHPVVVLLHGFPGNEKNLDLAQAMRRAGWDVLFFNYRGSWGSPGAFSFAHAQEDAQAAVAYLRDPATAKRLRADPTRIVVAGHSMGGWMAVATAAADPAIRAAILISAADMGGRGYAMHHAPDEPAAIQQGAASLAREGLAPLAGCTAQSLAQELAANGDRWQFLAYAPRLSSRPVFLISSDDGTGPRNAALAAALRTDGDKDVHELHLATDHSYSDKRIALEQAVLEDLASLKLNP